MITSKQIIQKIKNGDNVRLPITQSDLAELGWDFDEDEHFDQFGIDIHNGKVRLIGYACTGFNPGYGLDNHGAGYDYDEGIIVAQGIEQFGDEEGMKKFWEKVQSLF